jgi:membrane protein
MLDVLKQTFRESVRDQVPRLAAAVSFYSLLSLAPILLLSLIVARHVFGQQAGRGDVATALEAIAGPNAAEALQNLLQQAAMSQGEGSATVLGILVALYGASAVFQHVKRALNEIWDVPEKKAATWKIYLLQRVWAIVAAAIVIILVIATAMGVSVLNYVRDAVPEARWADDLIWRVIPFLATTVLYAFVFGLAFRYLPDLDLAWRHVWHGTLVTAILASLAQYGIGLYLGRSMIASAYGAAGSVVIVLLWIYATALIVFVGGELTEILSRDDRELAREREESQQREDHVARKPLPR